MLTSLYIRNLIMSCHWKSKVIYNLLYSTAKYKANSFINNKIFYNDIYICVCVVIKIYIYFLKLFSTLIFTFVLFSISSHELPPTRTWRIQNVTTNIYIYIYCTHFLNIKMIKNIFAVKWQTNFSAQHSPSSIDFQMQILWSHKFQSIRRKICSNLFTSAVNSRADVCNNILYFPRMRRQKFVRMASRVRVAKVKMRVENTIEKKGALGKSITPKNIYPPFGSPRFKRKLSTYSCETTDYYFKKNC